VTRLQDLDSGWIEDGLLKRRSNYSPIICFETADPKRLYQLKEYFVSNPDVASFERLVYDPWDGLTRLSPSAEGPVQEPYKKDPKSDTPVSRKLTREQGASPLVAFKSVLKEVDKQLKKEPTVFLIQNLADNREPETGLQSALRAWAIDPGLTAQKSAVFVVTSDINSILDEFTRQLVVIITVDPASDEERERIIEWTAHELEVTLNAEALSELIVATAGLNLHQLESILLESYYSAHAFELSTIKDLKSNLVRRSGTLEVRDPVNSFDDVGGYDVVKDFVRKYIINVLKQPDRSRRFALPLPKGILLFGPPGTGKTLFADALAKEINLPFINLVTENIYSKWLGESGQNLRNAIALAEKMSPAVVFVDEIDRFGKRGASAAGSAGEETKRVFSQFLEWLGRPNRQAIIVGTTNVPEHLDEAFTRTGRFDYKIPFLYPGRGARLEILKVHLGLQEKGSRPRPPLAIADEALLGFLEAEVVPLTRNFSGAELEELVTRAKRKAFDRGATALGKEDFLEAAQTFRIDHRRRQSLIEDYLDQAAKYTDDQQFLDSLQEEVEQE